MPFLMPDISSNNLKKATRADAKKIATVCQALMVKATEDETYTFPGFGVSERNARKAGMRTVAYHFVGTGPGVTQARHMWAVVKDSGVSALCIDWEAGSREIAKDMLHELQSLARGSDVTVGAYEGAWAREHGGGLPGCHFVIVPAYGSKTLSAAYKLKPYAGWQYTDGVHNGTSMPSSIPGIGHCDVSVIEQPDLIFGGHHPKPHPDPKPHPTPTPAPHGGWWGWFRHWIKGHRR